MFIKKWLRHNIESLIFTSALILGYRAYLTFFSNRLVFLNFDAISRLNIARRMVDSLSPGFGQLGSIWLPLPQLLMLPLVWIETFWRTSLAGSLPSIIAFAGTTVYLFRLLGMWSKKLLPRLLALTVFVFNINLLLLQSMAMSESLFLFFLVGAIYHLHCYARDTDNLSKLLLSAIHLALLTLVRYEGYAVLVSAIVYFLFITYHKTRKISVTEGKTILFTTLAGFGVVLWMIYLWAIFNDPIYSFRAYSHQVSAVASEGYLLSTSRTFSIDSWFQAFSTVFAATAYMKGILLTLLSFIILPFMLWREKVWQHWHYLIVILFLSVFGFLVFTVANNGISIAIVDISLTNLIGNHIYDAFEFSSRYGLLLLPFVVLMMGWFITRNGFTKVLGFFLIFVHLLSPFTSEVNLYYNLAKKWQTGSATTIIETNATDWFRYNYTRGNILISARIHDPMMFDLAIPYSRFVYEGTQQYWQDALEKPEKEVDWIVMVNPESPYDWIKTKQDSVGKILTNRTDWKSYFILKYSDEAIVIYQRLSYQTD